MQATAVGRTEARTRIEISPRARARITGAVYLLFFATSVAGALVMPGSNGLTGAPSNAAAEANAITGHLGLYELAVSLGLIATALYVALAGLFYQLFKPVSQTLSILMAFFSLVGCAVGAVGSLLQLAPVEILGGGSYLSVFSTQQLQSLALLFVDIAVRASGTSLLFFGAFQLVLGYLIFRSGFLPRAIGALIAVAGLGWFAFQSPALTSALSNYLEILGFIAEFSFMLWLLIKGVNGRAWSELAAQTGQR